MDTPPIRLTDSGTRVFMAKTTPIHEASSQSFYLDDQSHAVRGIVHRNPGRHALLQDTRESLVE